MLIRNRDHLKRYFEERFDRGQENECWLWKGYLLGSGYAITGHHQKERYYVHRVAYELYVGAIPDGMCVCHTCDVRHCVNYMSHLFLGTIAENLEDMTRKSRRAEGERLNNSRLSADDVREIRRIMRKYPFLSQQTVANTFDVSQTTISNIVRGKTRYKEALEKHEDFASRIARHTV